MSNGPSTSRIGLPEEIAAPAAEPIPEIAAPAAGAAARGGFDAIPPVARGGDLPLAFAQERVWLLCRLAPGSRAYQTQATLTIRGSLDVAALERALSAAVRRHEAFRTTFHDADGGPVQRIHPAWEVRLPVEDLAPLPPGEREEAARRRVREAFAHEIDPSRLPLVRWTLLRVEPDRHLLVHVEHHLIHDGWSFNVFLRDVLELYRARVEGRAPSLPALQVQFADVCAWQRAWMETDEARRALDSWRRRLAGTPPVLELPTDRPRPPVQHGVGGRVSFDLSGELVRRVRAAGRGGGATLFQVMLAAFAVFLSRMSGQRAVNVGTGIAGRGRPELEPVVGMFVNTVVVPVDLSGDPTFRELVARVRERALEAYELQEVPFDAVVQAVRPARDLGRNPLVQALFSFHDSPVPGLTLPGATVEVDLTAGNGSAKLDLNVICIPRAEGVTVIWEYDADLFDAETAERMAAHYRRLLASAAEAPERRAAELEMEDASALRELAGAWNATDRPYPRDACIHERFEAQARRTPGAVALAGAEGALTYAELNARANRLARLLRRRGVGPESRVGVCAERGPELVTALLAVLKAGGAYLPLDPAYPRDRLAWMLADGGAALVIAGEGQVAALPEGIDVVRMDEAREASAGEGADDPVSGAGAGHLAYVIYTSGSTGRPKGVMVPHRGVVRLACGQEHWGIEPAQSFLGFAPASFDAASFEVWCALLNGATVAFVPPHPPSLEELGDFIRARGLTDVWLTTGLFHQLVDAGAERFAGVRRVFTGGDVVSPAHVRRLLAACPGIVVYNCYGPTENSTFTTLQPFADADAVPEPLPIGRPIANTRTYVLDEGMRLLPPGVPGELYTGGDGVARGYLGRPALTAACFLPDPFIGRPGARMYRTGDRARWREGALEFMGRLDAQVKVRGFRIEPGEVEAALREHPGVAQAAVAARADGTGEKQLVGWIVPRGSAAPGVAALREHLLARLPAHMVPSAWVTIGAIPLDPNGKPDRRALPDPGAPAPGSTAAPRTPTEAALAAIWAEVLGVERVGVDDDVFDLGSHSLRATQAVSRIRRALGVDVSLRAVFEAPTIAALARHLDGLASAGASSIPPRLDRSPVPPSAGTPPAAARPGDGGGFVPPDTEMQRRVADIWARTLGRERVGIHDNFFDVGGHSLLLMRLHARIHALAPQAGVTMLDLFSHPTVALLAERLRGHGGNGNGRDGDAPAAMPRPSAPAAALAAALPGDRRTGREIAIVGMSGRFPGAADVAALWRNLREAVDCVSTLTDDELERAGVSAELRADPRRVRREGVLEGADLFDPGFFGVSAREAALLDPQQRVFLECAWHALEDAGHDPARFGGRIGVFAGAGTGAYLAHILRDPRLPRGIDPLDLRLGNDRDFLPTRVAYKLGLDGPAVNVQTACSTSLVAVHLACRALLDGDCELALAGGVSISIPQGAGYVYRTGGFRSPDGRCRAFDAAAAGLVPGSGAGVVVLRRLDDARADGDTVRAVILGSAVNNDGARRAGFTAPSALGQAQVLRAALADAGAAPESVGYVEAHGTGTELGDPIEVAALAEAYGPRPPGSIALGSVKTNVGHLDAAAGVTGLIKAALSLEHGELVPSLHFERPNPRIDFARTPFRVVTEPRPWTRGNTPRRAAVSAFGMGGTNAHAVLEEPPAREPADDGRAWQLLALSARSPGALAAAEARLAAHLRAHPAQPLADVAFTLAAGRRAFAHRLAVRVRRGEEAAAVLESRDPRRVTEGVAGEGPAPVVFLVPGRGAADAGAVRRLYDAEPVFRVELDRCAGILRPHLGLDPRPLLRAAAEGDAGAASRLAETRLAEPVSFAVSWAMARLWASLGVEPEAVAGQGAGELAAACVAGVFAVEDGLALAAERARLVHALPHGAMLAVPLDEDRLAPRLDGRVGLAAVVPGACVVAGPADAVAALRAALSGDGIRAREVPGPHALNSAMMEPAVEPLRRRVAEARISPPRVPLVSTVTGRWLTADEAADAGYWAGQLCRTVRFADAVSELAKVPERVFLDLGAGLALAGLARRHPACAGRVVVAGVDAEAEADEPPLLRAVAELWTAGAPVRLEALHAGERRRRVPLPGYPFERRRCWIDPSDGGEDA